MFWAAPVAAVLPAVLHTAPDHPSPPVLTPGLIWDFVWQVLGSNQGRDVDGFTSLKKRAGVKGLMCPFCGDFCRVLGMPGGGPGPRWSARLGVLAVGTGVIVGVYTSLASVLLLAFIFGYAQQTVTRFIDRKAADIAGTEKHLSTSKAAV